MSNLLWCFYHHHSEGLSRQALIFEKEEGTEYSTILKVPLVLLLCLQSQYWRVPHQVWPLSWWAQCILWASAMMFAETRNATCDLIESEFKLNAACSSSHMHAPEEGVDRDVRQGMALRSCQCLDVSPPLHGHLCSDVTHSSTWYWDNYFVWYVWFTWFVAWIN